MSLGQQRALCWQRPLLVAGTALHSPGGRSLLCQPHSPTRRLGCDSSQGSVARLRRAALPALAGFSQSFGWKSRRPSGWGMQCHKTLSHSGCLSPPSGSLPVAQKRWLNVWRFLTAFRMPKPRVTGKWALNSLRIMCLYQSKPSSVSTILRSFTLPIPSCSGITST